MFQIALAPDLELHLLTEAHCTPLFHLIQINREYLRRWLPWVDGTRTMDDTRRYVRFGLRQHAKHNGMHAGIWYQRRLAGIVSYNYVDLGKRQTELGYWLGQAYQGKGLMTTACRAMTTHAFEHLKLQRVEIRCAAHNEKSRAVPERLGYETVGIAPQLDWASDRYIDTIVYSMSAVEWQERKAIL
jgi:ribosomal-protein-serine acetyltransferase